MLVLAALGLRYGVLTEPGRNAVAGFADGLSLGRYGRLQLSGLKGDIFGRMFYRRRGQTRLTYRPPSA